MLSVGYTNAPYSRRALPRERRSGGMRRNAMGNNGKQMLCVVPITLEDSHVRKLLPPPGKSMLVIKGALYRPGAMFACIRTYINIYRQAKFNEFFRVNKIYTPTHHTKAHRGRHISPETFSHRIYATADADVPRCHTRKYSRTLASSLWRVIIVVSFVNIHTEYGAASSSSSSSGHARSTPLCRRNGIFTVFTRACVYTQREIQ